MITKTIQRSSPYACAIHGLGKLSKKKLTCSITKNSACKNHRITVYQWEHEISDFSSPEEKKKRQVILFVAARNATYPSTPPHAPPRAGTPLVALNVTQSFFRTASKLSCGRHFFHSTFYSASWSLLVNLRGLNNH